MGQLLSLAQNTETAQRGWHVRQAGAYDTAYANALTEPVGTEPHKMLAAIPSPFARFHIFDVAFGFVEAKDLEGASAFHAAVSQCLDALELLFHWQTHRNQRDKLEIVRWDAESSFKLLSGGVAHTSHKVLSEALDLYLNQDSDIGAMAGIDGLWMISIQEDVKRSVLALSSPFTIVSPAPEAGRVARRMPLKVPGENRVYFQEIIPLHRRSAPFRAYVRGLFAKPPLANRCERMYKYIQAVWDKTEEGLQGVAQLQNQSLQPIIDDAGAAQITVHRVALSSLTPRLPDIVTESPRRIAADRGDVERPPILLVDGYNSVGRTDASFKAPLNDPAPVRDRFLPDYRCFYPYLVQSDLLADYIVRVPYPLNTAQFILPIESGTGDAAYLPPIKPAFFEYFSQDKIRSHISFNALEGGGVTCELRIPLTDGRVQKLSRKYYENPQLAGAGRVVTAGSDLALFPVIRSSRASRPGESPINASAEDDADFRALMLVEEQGSDQWRSHVDLFVLHADGTRHPVKATPYVRTPKERRAGVATKVYLFNGDLPDLVELAIDVSPGVQARGALCPAAERREPGTKSFIVAVDFGTTNSHVAIAESPQGAAEPKPTGLAPKGAVATLHNPAATGPLVTLAEKAMLHEFVPPTLGEGRLAFPTRTALAERLGQSTHELFGGSNIAFFLYRHTVRPQHEQIRTHLKWAKKGDTDTEARVELFIRELLYLIRAEVTLRGGDASKTELLWFWPLSFTEYLRGQLQKQWSRHAKAILGTTRVTNITESAAPYYYHYLAAADIVSQKPVLSIDIGGGSTDVVFFDRREPRFGTSFNFAGNALWGDGFSLAKDAARPNGVVDWARAKIEEKTQKLDAERRADVQEVTAGFGDVEGLRGSEEQINLWFALDRYVGFVDLLGHEPIIKMMVLLHYSAIAYHCAEMTRALALEQPEVLCFSGYGTKALEVIDFQADHEFLSMHTTAIFAAVYNHRAAIHKVPVASRESAVSELRKILGRARPTPSMKVLVASKPKQATCEGGIWGCTVGNARTSRPNPAIMLGTDDSVRDYQDVPTYADLTASDTANAADGFRRFLALFEALSHYYEDLGIPTRTINENVGLLWEKVDDTIAFGLERRKLSVDSPTEKVLETLFFYPLVDKLWRLSHRLKK